MAPPCLSDVCVSQTNILLAWRRLVLLVAAMPRCGKRLRVPSHQDLRVPRRIQRLVVQRRETSCKRVSSPRAPKTRTEGFGSARAFALLSLDKVLEQLHNHAHAMARVTTNRGLATMRVAMR